jgi:hypothetical protein
MIIFKGTIKVLIVVVLALGWYWADVALEYKLINKDERFWILISVTALLAVQQAYFALPKPAKKNVIDQRFSLLKPYLENFLKEYYDLLRTCVGEDSPVLPTVRVNVMLPTRKLRGLLGVSLKIFYFTAPNGILYSNEEKIIKWKKGEFTWGWAWKEPNSYFLYDSDDVNYKLPTGQFNKRKNDVIQSIKSSVSYSIWRDEKIAGILTLDSKQNIRDTNFFDNDILELTQAFSMVLSRFCFDDGVEG